MAEMLCYSTIITESCDSGALDQLCGECPDWFSTPARDTERGALVADFNLHRGRFPGERKGNPLQYSCLKSPIAEEPGGLQSMGSQRIGHNRATSVWAKEKTFEIVTLLVQDNWNRGAFAEDVLSPKWKHIWFFLKRGADWLNIWSQIQN